MPEWTPQLLLFVFVTHLPFFAWKYQRTREIRFAATTRSDCFDACSATFPK